MKITKTTSLQVFLPASLAALAIIILWGISVRPAQAGYIVTFKQVAPDVVATGSGPIDLTGLTGAFNAVISPFIGANPPNVSMGPVSAQAPAYAGSMPFSGPSTFGSGLGVFANFGSGDPVQIIPPFAVVVVPVGYVSGTPLSDSATYSSQTFATLGVTPGTYEWTWGTGANQNFTLQIGPTAGVPDSGSTVGLLFVSLIALFGLGRFRAQRLV